PALLVEDEDRFSEGTVVVRHACDPAAGEVRRRRSETHGCRESGQGNQTPRSRSHRVLRCHHLTSNVKATRPRALDAATSSRWPRQPAWTRLDWQVRSARQVRLSRWDLPT